MENPTRKHVSFLFLPLCFNDFYAELYSYETKDTVIPGGSVSTGQVESILEDPVTWPHGRLLGLLGSHFSEHEWREAVLGSKTTK